MCQKDLSCLVYNLLIFICTYSNSCVPNCAWHARVFGYAPGESRAGMRRAPVGGQRQLQRLTLQPPLYTQARTPAPAHSAKISLSLAFLPLSFPSSNTHYPGAIVSCCPPTSTFMNQSNPHSQAPPWIAPGQPKAGR